MRVQSGDLLAVFFFSLVFPGHPCFAAFDPPSQVCLSEDNQTCLVLSPLAAQELRAANNPYGDDIQLSIERLPTEEINETLRSIRITAANASSGQVLDGFFFQNPVQLRLGNWTLFQIPATPGSGQTPSGPLTPIGNVLQWLGVYWDNGQGTIRLGGLSLDANQSLCATVHNVGHYQIVVARPAAALALSHGSPYPRIITPNGRYNRRAFFFVDNPGSDPITGTIYDFQGSKIRDLQVDALSPAPNALAWDGRDASGNVVPSGPYLYKISTGGQNVTGGLVVAR